MKNLKSLFVSSRPLSWVNTAFPFAAAYFMSTRQIDVVFIVGTIYFLIPYNLAMYGINDVFDYESDLRNPRKGGVEGALLDPSVHRLTLCAAIVLNVPFLVFLVAVGSPLSWLVLAISVFAVIAYSAPGLRFKERPFIDSLTSSTHFVSPAVYGFVLAATVFTPALWAVLAAFFLWGIASHAFGAVQDIVADREGGIASIATVIGGRATVRLAFCAYLLAGILLLFTRFPGPFAAVLVLPYALTVLPYWNITDADAETANRGWRRFLTINFAAGFLVTMLLIWYGILTVGCAGTTVHYSGSSEPLRVGQSEMGPARDFVACR
ncbi:prenyltransferase [Lacisediminihabitans sp. H27-G8]